jgi:protein TonB
MSATVNAFPPLHAFNSSRSWFLALIALLHMGFFWALTNGVSIWTMEKTPPPFVVVDVPVDIIDEPEPLPPEPTDIRAGRVDPVPMPNEIDYRERVEERAPVAGPREDPVSGPGTAVPMPPVIVDPQGDSRYPLTEPEYPVSEIRLQHEGTVWLSIQILPNGRVGAVRVDQSSGFVKLDESAMREARRWRMKPGTQDGVATAMWKRVPVTFRLKD